MTSDKNRRKYPRIDVELTLNVDESGDPEVITATTKNIGGGGLCVYVDRLLKMDEQLQIYLKLPDDQPPLAGLVCVRWWHKKRQLLKKNAGTFIVGLEFVNLESDQQERLHRFTQEFSL